MSDCGHCKTHEEIVKMQAKNDGKLTALWALFFLLITSLSGFVYWVHAENREYEKEWKQESVFLSNRIDVVNKKNEDTHDIVYTIELNLKNFMNQNGFIYIERGTP